MTFYKDDEFIKINKIFKENLIKYTVNSFDIDKMSQVNNKFKNSMLGA